MQGLLQNAVGEVLVDFASGESDTTAEVLQLAGADVGCHNDNCVLEVDTASEAVGQASLVHYLQQQVEHVGVSFFYFIEQHHRVWMTAHLLGKLAALFIAHISRRRTYQARHCELLHILTHVDTDKCVRRIEQILGKLLGQVSLAYACRTKEHKCTYGFGGVFQTYAVAVNSFDNTLDGLILSDD